MKTPIEQFEEKFGTSMTMKDIKNLLNELKLVEQQIIEQAFLDGAEYEANLHDDCNRYISSKVAKHYFYHAFLN
jgi:hypothetical protein